MFQSTFLRRIILIIILALSISALLTTVLFTLASSQSLELSRQTDLLERAYAIADHYALFDGEFEEYSWNDLVSDHSFVGAQTYIYDSSGKLITQSVDNNDVDNDFLVRVSNFLDSNLIQLARNIIPLS